MPQSRMAEFSDIPHLAGPPGQPVHLNITPAPSASLREWKQIYS